jgi:hypothetical protein
VLRFYATDSEVLVHDEVEFTYYPAPEIIFTAQDRNVITIYWTSVPGKNYRVHYKNSLSDATWTALTGNILATEDVTSSVITNIVSPRFYRVWAP